MSVSIQELGQRLKLLRKRLDLSQESLAESMGVNQNQISRLENGVGGTIELLLLLFSFFSKHFHVDLLFSDSFDILEKHEKLSNSHSLNSIAVEKLKLAQSEFSTQIEEVIRLLNTP